MHENIGPKSGNDLDWPTDLTLADALSQLKTVIPKRYPEFVSGRDIDTLIRSRILERLEFVVLGLEMAQDSVNPLANPMINLGLWDKDICYFDLNHPAHFELYTELYTEWMCLLPASTQV